MKLSEIKGIETVDIGRKQDYVYPETEIELDIEKLRALLNRYAGLSVSCTAYSINANLKDLLVVKETK
jgi:hypothetical protein